MNHTRSTTTWRLAATLSTLLALLLTTTAVMAEPPGPPDGPAGERLHERMIELRSRLLRKRMGLDSARVAEVEALLQKRDAERKALHQAMKRSRRALRDLVEEDSTDQEAFDAAVGTLLKTRKQLHELRQQELQSLRRVLTPKEMGLLVLALGRLRHKMHRMHDEHRRGGDHGFRRGGHGDRGSRGRHRGRRHRGDDD